jgi:hypothetical protein
MMKNRMSYELVLAQLFSRSIQSSYGFFIQIIAKELTPEVESQSISVWITGNQSLAAYSNE